MKYAVINLSHIITRGSKEIRALWFYTKLVKNEKPELKTIKSEILITGGLQY